MALRKGKVETNQEVPERCFLDKMKSMNEDNESRNTQMHIWGSGQTSAWLKQRLSLGVSRKKSRQLWLSWKPHKFWNNNKSLKQRVIKKVESIPYFYVP